MTKYINTLNPSSGEGNVNGFGLEFFIETPSDEIADSVEEIKTSWQFQLLYTVSQLAAGVQPAAASKPSCTTAQGLLTVHHAQGLLAVQAMAASNPSSMT